MTMNPALESADSSKSEPAAKPRFETPTYSTGPCLVPSLDNTSKLLAFLDDEDATPWPTEPHTR